MGIFDGFKKTFYKAKAKCLNCNWKGKLEVEKTYEVNDWYCPKCHCQTIKKIK